MMSPSSSLSALHCTERPVWLLKTPSRPCDAYENDLRQSTDLRLKPIFVPVLEHLFRHDAMQNIARHIERFAFASGSPATARHKASDNLARRYSGLIFTSQRAVEAFQEIIVYMRSRGSISHLFDDQMPIYVVGPATAQGVRALDLPCKVIGEETGNGEALAALIIKHHHTLPDTVSHLAGRKLPLLFLVGEQRRDTIPSTLDSHDLSQQNRIPVQEVVVYETGEKADFEEEFAALMSLAKTIGFAEQWVVVFSPQGCEAMLNGLGWLDPKTGLYDSQRRRTGCNDTMDTYLMTIGPTTRQSLMETFGISPDTCAARPSPQGVLAALDNFYANKFS